MNNNIAFTLEEWRKETLALFAEFQPGIGEIDYGGMKYLSSAVNAFMTAPTATYYGSYIEATTRKSDSIVRVKNALQVSTGYVLLHSLILIPGNVYYTKMDPITFDAIDLEEPIIEGPTWLVRYAEIPKETHENTK